MAEVPITINGVICDLYGRTISGPVKIVGSLVRSDVGVGGGPIYPPPEGGKPPGMPPGIWPGPGDPDFPGGLPHPEHPIVLPPNKPPVDPPTEPPTSPADPQWVWGYSPKLQGWTPVYVPPEGAAGPK